MANIVKSWQLNEEYYQISTNIIKIVQGIYCDYIIYVILHTYICTGWGKSPATILIAYNFVQRKDKSVWFSYNVYLVFTFFLRYD